MEFNISVQSEDQDLAVEEALLLRENIEIYAPEADSRQLEKKLAKDDAGLSILDAAVKIVFGSDFIDKILDTLKTWISSRAGVIDAKKAKFNLTYKDADGKDITITLENAHSIKDLSLLLNNIIPSANNDSK
ncbi:hypothetical protein [Chitinophaga sp. MM2321]|uniref:hypothetical protein n=1 Tax=Chitinophaga sp. MM2321 TaxID=3137178 RepID=UPI0032D59204